MTVSASVPCTLLLLAVVCVLLEQAAKDSKRLWTLLGSRPPVVAPMSGDSHHHLGSRRRFQAVGGLLSDASIAWFAWLVGMMLGGPLWGVLSAVVGLAVRQVQRMACALRRRRAVAAGLRGLVRDLHLLASSGETALRCVSRAAEQAPEPVRALVTSAVLAVHMGKPLYPALAAVEELAVTESYSEFLQIVWLHTETGASFASMLADSVRRCDEVALMHSELEAKLGEARWTARVLALVPIAVLAYMIVFSPSSLRPMLHDSTGIAALIVGGALWAVGLLIVARMQIPPASLGVQS